MVGCESRRTSGRIDKFARRLEPKAVVHVHMGLETELRVDVGIARGLWDMLVLKKGISIRED